LRKLYAQGGQQLNPYKHIFGLADSPKAKSLCVGGLYRRRDCGVEDLLVMPEGYGGAETFMLDVTNPFGASGINDPPFTVQWHTGVGASADTTTTCWATRSPCRRSSSTRTRVSTITVLSSSSGYAVTEGSTTQGRTLVTASAISGAVISTSSVSPSATCAQEYAALTDVADRTRLCQGPERQARRRLLRRYLGQLWRYTLAGGLSLDYNFTCDQPLHFSPTVVQLDRDSVASSHAHEIYLVQVTKLQPRPGHGQTCPLRR